MIGVSPFYAHGDEEHPDETSAISAEELKTCLFLENGRAECYASMCGNLSGYSCAEEILDVAVSAAGPEKSMMALHDILQSPAFSILDDGHPLAHVIGRSLSKNSGPTGEIFCGVRLILIMDAFTDFLRTLGESQRPGGRSRRHMRKHARKRFLQGKMVLLSRRGPRVYDERSLRH